MGTSDPPNVKRPETPAHYPTATSTADNSQQFWATDAESDLPSAQYEGRSNSELRTRKRSSSVRSGHVVPQEDGHEAAPLKRSLSDREEWAEYIEALDVEGGSRDSRSPHIPFAGSGREWDGSIEVLEARGGGSKSHRAAKPDTLSIITDAYADGRSFVGSMFSTGAYNDIAPTPYAREDDGASKLMYEEDNMVFDGLAHDRTSGDKWDANADPQGGYLVNDHWGGDVSDNFPFRLLW